jgi:uncharacterized repeat protein (TIGR01451 family)
VTVRAPSVSLSPASQSVVAGGKATFKVTVDDTSGVKLTNVTVADPLASDCAHTIGTLDAGASQSYSCSRSGVTAGFTDIVTARGKAPSGSTVTATASAKVTVSAPFAPPPHVGITVTKTKTKTGVTVTMSIPDVLFAFSKYTLRPGAAQVLATVSKLLKVTYAKGHITVTGYTDGIGSVAYNLVLSKERATTVADWLEQHGISTGRVSIAWKGKADPIASNATAQGRQKNRRVTITVKEGHS